ncbi:MAG: hypothetical protein ABII00_02935 [Elusimicrobiota bacterium]
MKRILIIVAVVLVVVDAAALFIWWSHKRESEGARPAAVLLPETSREPAAALREDHASRRETAPDPQAPGPGRSGGSLGTFRTPGGCKSAAECDTYCSDRAHYDECLAFVGTLDDPKKPPAFGPGAPSPGREPPAPGEEGWAPTGPGGCQGKECEEYCRQPGHEAECRRFAQGERRRIAGNIGETPIEVQECISDRVGGETLEGLLRGEVDIDPRIGRAIEECYQAGSIQVGPKEDKNRYDTPGNCRNTAQCMAHCKKPENKEECLAWEGLPDQFREMLEQQDAGPDLDDDSQ